MIILSDEIYSELTFENNYKDGLLDLEIVITNNTKLNEDINVTIWTCEESFQHPTEIHTTMLLLHLFKPCVED